MACRYQMSNWASAKLSSCFKKARYNTQGKAEAYRLKRLHAQPNLRIYYCTTCLGWHLTKKQEAA